MKFYFNSFVGTESQSIKKQTSIMDVGAPKKSMTIKITKGKIIRPVVEVTTKKALSAAPKSVKMKKIKRKDSRPSAEVPRQLRQKTSAQQKVPINKKSKCHNSKICCVHIVLFIFHIQ